MIRRTRTPFAAVVCTCWRGSPIETPEIAPEDASRALAELKGIVDRLRAPDGCPWDREQTPESLRSYLLEEAHEVAAAIDAGDPVELAEELGDLLLNVFLQARIGEERGTFTLAEVANKISAKLIRRHPHVFADSEAKDSDEVRATWEEIKRREKPHTSTESVLRQLPATLPALERAQRWGKMAAEYGFDWPSVTGPLDKVREELLECEQELATSEPIPGAGAADSPPQRQRRVHEELGDLLLAVTSVCRHCDVNAEGALNDALQRFKQRFEHVEEQLGPQHRLPKEQRAPLEEMERLWQQAKSNDKK